ncbi:MAG TPA: hypothetical protein VF190_02885 [Rhodothermales bacterium]
MPLRYVVLSGALLASVLLAACDAAPGAEETSSTPPVVSEFQYNPDLVILGGLPDTDVTDDSVRFTVSVEVSAVDADGQVQEVTYTLRTPDSQAPVVSTGAMQSLGGNRYGAEVDVRIAKGQVGNYTLSVFAIDDTGRLSNTVRGMVRFTADGGPPVIVEIIAEPDTIHVDRDSVLTLIAVVNDPDGLSNIADVTVITPNGQRRPMHDDGATHGDPVAGDGRYYARFEGVNLATPNTTQVFAFQATDRTGLSSELVEKPIRVE